MEHANGYYTLLELQFFTIYMFFRAFHFSVFLIEEHHFI